MVDQVAKARKAELADFYVGQLTVLHRHAMAELNAQKRGRRTLERLRHKSQTLGLVLAKLGYDEATVKWLNE